VTNVFNKPQNQDSATFYGHYTGQPVLSSTSSQELENFDGAKFYCPHALADGNQHIQIWEKMLSSPQHCFHTISKKPQKHYQL